MVSPCSDTARYVSSCTAFSISRTTAFVLCCITSHIAAIPNARSTTATIITLRFFQPLRIFSPRFFPHQKLSSSDTAQSRQMCLCRVASAIQKDGAVPKSPVLCEYTAFAKRLALVLLKLLEEGEVILTLFVGESDRRPGMLVQVAGQQVLDVIAPYHAVVFQLLHLIL